MGCGASTKIEENNPLLQKETGEDITQLSNTAGDLGNSPHRDPNIFGDQLDLKKMVTEEDTNFHHSPSDGLKDLTSNTVEPLIKSDLERDTNPNIYPSSASLLNHEEENTKSKTADNTNGEDEFIKSEEKIPTKHNDVTSQQQSPHSISSSRQSRVYRPTASSSEEEASKLSTKISQEISKQYEDSQKSKSQIPILTDHTTDNTDHEYRNSRPQKVSNELSLHTSENEKSEKVSLSSHTLTESNRSPYFDSINANADINQNHDQNPSFLSATGDINQNHHFKRMVLQTDDYKEECLSPYEESITERPQKDFLSTANMYFEKMPQFIEDDNHLKVTQNELQSDLRVASTHNKITPSSRASRISGISKQSSTSLNFKCEYLKTAEVHDGNCEESLHGFDMKDGIVDFNQEENEVCNLSETKSPIITLPENEDINGNQYEE